MKAVVVSIMMAYISSIDPNADGQSIVNYEQEVEKELEKDNELYRRFELIQTACDVLVSRLRPFNRPVFFLGLNNF